MEKCTKKRRIVLDKLIKIAQNEKNALLYEKNFVTFTINERECLKRNILNEVKQEMTSNHCSPSYDHSFYLRAMSNKIGAIDIEIKDLNTLLRFQDEKLLLCAIKIKQYQKLQDYYELCEKEQVRKHDLKIVEELCLGAITIE